jgi:CMP-N-acetylneuraminic acid synthetase
MPPRVKRIEDVGFVIQARLGSMRVPRKMIRPFARTTLLDNALDIVSRAETIPKRNLYLAVHERELADIGRIHGVQILERSAKSANGEDLLEIYEWHDRFPFDYVVLISACAPFLTASTIDEFVRAYLRTSEDGLFGVVEERNYFWDAQGSHLTRWPAGLRIMNTKFVEPTFRAAHCLYAGRRARIADGVWMGTFLRPGDPALFVMNPFEAFDIDYAWQFDMAEAYYARHRGEQRAS